MPREKSPTNVTVRTRAPRKAAAEAAKAAASFTSFVDPRERMALIAEAAYFRAERRGFAAGCELEDWFAAEAEVDAKLMRATSSVPRV
jgi:hypothetical protein